jgi:hypothetical protein
MLNDIGHVLDLYLDHMIKLLNVPVLRQFVYLYLLVGVFYLLRQMIRIR